MPINEWTHIFLETYRRLPTPSRCERYLSWLARFVHSEEDLGQLPFPYSREASPGHHARSFTRSWEPSLESKAIQNITLEFEIDSHSSWVWGRTRYASRHVFAASTESIAIRLVSQNLDATQFGAPDLWMKNESWVAETEDDEHAPLLGGETRRSWRKWFFFI